MRKENIHQDFHGALSNAPSMKDVVNSSKEPEMGFPVSS